MSLATTFGPVVGGNGPDDAVTNFDAPYPAVQIYQVAGAQPAATVQSAASTVRVYGAPESLITLAGDGLLGNRPVLLNNDGAGQPAAGDVDTDSLRRRAVNFGQLRSNFSPTLTATQPAGTFLSASDYTEPGWAPYQAVARYTGIANITASSSESDLGSLPGQWATGLEPYSAVDSDLRTMWESGSWNGPAGQWIQEDFVKPVNPGTIQVAFADNAAIGPPVTEITVTTVAGKITDHLQVTGNLQTVAIPRGATRWLRIAVTGLAYQPAPAFGTQVGVADIVVPGVSPGRAIVAPPVPGGDPAAVVLSKAQPPVSGCMLTSLRWVCSPLLSSVTEEQYGFDQAFTESFSERTVVRGQAILSDTSLVGKYSRFARSTAPTVTASSAYLDDPQDQARSAFDGNPATSWTASPSDANPKLTIDWGHPKRISQITIERPPGAAALTQVLITGSKGQRRGAIIGANGVVKMAPMTTASLSFTFTPVQSPLQISDVAIPGVPYIGTPVGSFGLPCGFGPDLVVDGKTVPTKVSGTFAEELNGEPMPFTACSPVTVAAGANQVTEPVLDGFSVQDVTLGTLPSASASAAAAPVAATVKSWGSSVRTLTVSAPVRSYLVVNQNYNVGWRAVIDGKRLQPVRLDGWKQAWVLPAGTAGPVTLSYGPQASYQDSVIAGLAIAFVIIVFAFWPWRRRRRTSASAPWVPWPDGGARRAGRLRWTIQWRLGAPCVPLIILGLLLGGWPGAVIVPVVTIGLLLVSRRLRVLASPWLLAIALTAASVAGAIGVHLELTGDSGLIVSAPVDAIPQAMCLIVVAALAAALLRGAVED
jgi:arabinofuranan 3-O-arabinosyltransferase